jgi:hypothetical protein
MRLQGVYALLALTGCLDLPDEAGSAETAQAIVGGQETSQWPAIGWVHGGGERCSGTLIAPNAFLTAAHCTEVGLPLHVGFGAYRTGAETSVTRIYRSPDWVHDNFPFHDVAVLILESPRWDIAPMALSGYEYPSAVPAGRELRVTGYGDDKPGLSAPDPNVTAPRKTAHIHVDFADWNVIGASGINGGACFGDSGGPITDLDVTKVYAVQSSIFFPCDVNGRLRGAPVAYEPIIQQALYENPPAPSWAASPFWRYFNAVNLDHYYDLTRNDAGFGYFGYGIETYEGRLFAGQWPGTVPLYRYWNPGIGDHFYTSNFGELGYGAYGWGLEAVAGYVFPVPYAGTVPLYRYYSAYATDHYYRVTRDDAGMAYYGYGFEKIEGYVYP